VTSPRWDDLQALFAAALDLPLAEREAFLDTACAGDPALREELASLLAAHGTGGAVDRLADIVIDGLAGHMRDPVDPGDRVGMYRVVRQVARGGMGAVYVAERDDQQFQQRVALKFLRPGHDYDELRRRFATERRILGQLVHPSIARLLDAGVSSHGLPYLVMEFVEGAPIDRYCDDQRLAIDERLDLFCRVCDAVQYAHQNLVVHRDLKPSNILVDEGGAVKLLDFGIAKLLEEDAESSSPRTATRWMTPEYASPEQVRGGPITTATDTYALGILLFELLTGRRPYETAGKSAGEIEHAVCETDPPRPSTVVAGPITGGLAAPGGATDPVSAARHTQPERLRRRLRGDLDVIVLHALHKEPARRYASAGELASDVRRHLAGLPVRAQPDSFRYRAGKFVRRHRVGVGAGVLLGLSLLAGTAATAWQARIAARERDQARLEAETAAAVSTFLADLFASADPGRSLGTDPPVSRILAAGAARAESELAGQPALQGRLLFVIGDVYRSMGRFAAAESLLARSAEVRRAALGDRSPDLAESLTGLATVLLAMQRPNDAEPLLREALMIWESALGPEAPRVAGAMNNLGSLFHNRGLLDSAAAYYGRAVTLRQRAGDDTTPSYATDLGNLASVLARQGDLEAADSLQRRVLALRRTHLEPNHPDVAASLNNLAVVLYRKEDFAGAERMLREALDIRRAVLGPEHPEVAQGLNNLAAAVEKQGDLVAAERLYQESLALKRRIVGDAHPTVATSLNNLGVLERARGNLDTALALFREALAVRRAAYPDGHPSLATSLDNLGALFRAGGDLEAAEEPLREALELRRRLLAADHPELGHSAATLGAVLGEQGRCAEAEPLLAEGLRVRQAALPAGHQSIGVVQGDLGRCQLALGREVEAEQSLPAALDGLTASRGADDSATQRVTRELARLYDLRGDTARAATYRARLAVGGS
jgi:serine/threonine-protein kinase